MAFSAVYLHSWISYTKGVPSPFAIVPSLVWQQILLTTSSSREGSELIPFSKECRYFEIHMMTISHTATRCVSLEIGDSQNLIMYKETVVTVGLS